MKTQISNLGRDLSESQRSAVEQSGREVVPHYRYYFDATGVCVGHRSRPAYSNRAVDITPQMRQQTADEIADATQEAQDGISPDED